MTPYFSDYSDPDSRPLIPYQFQESGVPLPTLYNGDHAHLTPRVCMPSTSGGPVALERGLSGPSSMPSQASGGRHRPRMGAIEFLLYNMASMLAGVAAGYDVRLSNVMPIHPKLHPIR